MASVDVKANRVVDATPANVYAFLVDFKERHPKILPPSFSNYRVEEGGIGSGTAIAYHLKAGRSSRDYHMTIEADEATHRIVERDRDTTLRTTWTLTPRNGGASTSVDIETTWVGGTGIGGFFERTFAPLVLRRIYDEELALLQSALRNA